MIQFLIALYAIQLLCLALATAAMLVATWWRSK